MDIPISSETVVLYGFDTDPRIIEAKRKLELQGRIVLVNDFPAEPHGAFCYCKDVFFWPHSHQHKYPHAKI